MVGVHTQVRKWGDSLAVIIPKYVANEERITERDTIYFEVKKELDLAPLFGTAKLRGKKTLQQLRDENKDRD